MRACYPSLTYPPVSIPMRFANDSGSTRLALSSDAPTWELEASFSTLLMTEVNRSAETDQIHLCSSS